MSDPTASEFEAWVGSGLQLLSQEQGVARVDASVPGDVAAALAQEQDAAQVDASIPGDIAAALAQPPVKDGLKVAMRFERGLTDGAVLKQPFFFQCPPLDSFSWSRSYNFDDYDTINAGQFSRPSSRQLRTLSLSTLFIDWDAPWALAPATLPLVVADQLQAILDSGTPFRLIAYQPEMWGPGQNDINIIATMRTLTVEHRGGEPDTRYVSIDFTEFRKANMAGIKHNAHFLPTTASLIVKGHDVGFQIGNGGPSVPAQKHPTFHDLLVQAYGSGSPRYKNLVVSKNRHLLENVSPSTRLSELAFYGHAGHLKLRKRLPIIKLPVPRK